MGNQTGTVCFCQIRPFCGTVSHLLSLYLTLGELKHYFSFKCLLVLVWLYELE